MNTPGLAITLCIGMVTFAGCATTPGQCDPRNENFFNNTRCLASGSYGERQQNLQAQLQAEQRRNSLFRAMLAELDAERQQVSASLAAREREYGSLDAAWHELKQALSRQAQHNEDLRRRIAQIDQDLAARQDPLVAADALRKAELRDDLKRKVGLLQQELDAGIYD